MCASSPGLAAVYLSLLRSGQRVRQLGIRVPLTPIMGSPNPFRAPSILIPISLQFLWYDNCLCSPLEDLA